MLVRMLFLVLVILPSTLQAMDVEADSKQEDDDTSLLESDGGDGLIASDKSEAETPLEYPKIAGVTLKKIEKFLHKKWNYTLWTSCEVLLGSALAFAFFWHCCFGLSGGLTAGAYCANRRGLDTCRELCNGDYTCRNKCGDLGAIQTLSDPACIGGLFLVSLIGLPVLAMPLSIPIARLQNWWASRLSEKHRLYLVQNLTRGRSLDEELTDQDMLFAGAFLMAADSKLLKELSPAQALGLAEADLKKFSELVEKDVFSVRANALGNKLLRLLQMNALQLGSTLEERDMIALFKLNPILWQTLVRTLPYEIKTDSGVEKGLKKSISALLAGIQNGDGLDWTKVIDQIVQGRSINAYLLKEVTVLEENAPHDEQILIKTASNQEIPVHKKRLIAVSKYFEAACSGRWSKADGDLSLVDPSWVEILVDVANGKKPTLTPDNVQSAIGAAFFFQMPSVIKSCDNFIAHLGLSSKPVQAILATEQGSYNDDTSTFAAKWKFCDKYAFSENKRIIASQLLVQLNDLSMEKPSVLIDIKLLPKADIAQVISSFDVLEFNRKLANPKFLNLAWDHVQGIDFLEDAIVAYCSNHHNSYVVDGAFACTPTKLKRAIARYRSRQVKN